MTKIDTVLLKVTSRCNIDCSYCYVYNLGDLGWSRQPKRMSMETSVAVADSLSELAFLEGHRFAVVLHGGEPMLLGKDGLASILTKLRLSLPDGYSISIQSNGTLLTRDIIDLCEANDTTISLSLDGPRHIHDRNRVGFDSSGTFDRVMEGLELLLSHPAGHNVFSGVLSVVDPTSDPSEVYSFLKELNVPSLDFIYKDGNHSRLPPGKESASTTEYGDWMTKLFDVYTSDPHPVQIRILDDLIKLVLGGSGTKEGTGITNYGMLIIDTDGSITKNDTLKSSFDGADRFNHAWSVHTHRLADIIQSTDFVESLAMQRPTSNICLECRDLHVCGGGMTLHRWSGKNGYDNPSVFCADQKLLIQRIRSVAAGLVGNTP